MEVDSRFPDGSRDDMMTPLMTAPRSTLRAGIRVCALTTCLTWLAWGAGGCNSSPLGRGFESADPSQQISASEEAVRKGDEDAIPHLIEGLDSDDPAVRFVSIHALEQLTGKTYGYKHFAPPWEREAAIDRWVDAVNNKEIGVSSAPED